MDAIICLGLGIAESWLLWALNFTTYSHMQTAGILSSIQYLVIKFYRVFLYHRYFSPLRHIPGPKNDHFFFGQSFNFINAESPTDLYVQWMKQWPNAPFIRYLTFGNAEVLLANSLAVHRQILSQECYTFTKPKRFRKIIAAIAGEGLLLLEGGQHRAHRKMLNTPLSIPSIRKLQPVFEEKSKELCELLEHRVENGGIMDCTEVFTRATLDLIGRTVLGVELNNVTSMSYDQGMTTSSRIPERSTPVRHEYTFHDAYEIIFAQSLIGKILMFAQGFFPVRWIPIKANYDFLNCTAWVDRMLRSLIRERTKEAQSAFKYGKEGSSKESRDILTFMAEERMPGQSGEAMVEDIFVGHLMSLMSAGHATTAETLTWCVHIMANDPGIQEAARKEVRDMLQRSLKPTYNDITNCTYLENLIKETLRLYTPAAIFQRQSTRDLIIADIHLPKGTSVDFLPAVPMRNPTIWGEDVEHPDPTRFERLSGDQLSPYAFMAFGGGPRICIGKHYAMLELKVLLIDMLRRFRFTATGEKFTIENPGFTMRANGLKVKIEKIDGF